jgi:hypothetical protein
VEISPISIAPPASGAIVSGITGPAALRRGVDRRRVVVRAVDALDGALRRELPAALRVRDAALRVVVAARLRVVDAARRPVVDAARRLVVDAARRLVADAREPAPRTTWRACFVSASTRFKTLLTSARVLAFFACAWSCLIAARAVFSASLILRWTWRRRSGGTLFSASRKACLPAFTARPTRPERVLRRFLVAMLKPPLNRASRSA